MFMRQTSAFSLLSGLSKAISERCKRFAFESQLHVRFVWSGVLCSNRYTVGLLYI
jgi:hypothetical protein